MALRARAAERTFGGGENRDRLVHENGRVARPRHPVDGVFDDDFFGGGAGVMTKEQAVAQKKELMADNAWVKSYNEGDAVKGRQMRALNVLITGA